MLKVKDNNRLMMFLYLLIFFLRFKLVNHGKRYAGKRNRQLLRERAIGELNGYVSVPVSMSLLRIRRLICGLCVLRTGV